MMKCEMVRRIEQESIACANEFWQLVNEHQLGSAQIAAIVHEPRSVVLRWACSTVPASAVRQLKQHLGIE